VSTSRTLPTGVLAVLVALAVLLWSPSPASGVTPGEGETRLRVGHFALATPDLVVEIDGRPLLREPIGYGTISDYQVVEPGSATVTFRSALEPAGSPPLATTEVDVEAGNAYSVVVAGTADQRQAKAFRDELTAPAEGSGRVRLVHLAPGVPAVDARVRDGIRLFEDAVFGDATSYVDVPAGVYDLEMLRAGTDQVLLAVRGVTVEAGSVYTMVGTGGGDQPVEVQAFVDAAGAAAMPRGGVAAGFGGAAGEGGAAGFGGAAPEGSADPVALTAGTALAGAALVAGLVATGRVRRRAGRR
jgi:hypothetical protein